MPVRVFTVDAFTDRPFRGNPAAVCPLAGDAEWDAQWMQAVASEMKLSETAFMRPRQGGGVDLRWFTPAGGGSARGGSPRGAEAALGGHARRGGAQVLGGGGALLGGRGGASPPRGGVWRGGGGAGGLKRASPAEPAQPAEAPPALVEALR